MFITYYIFYWRNTQGYYSLPSFDVNYNSTLGIWLCLNVHILANGTLSTKPTYVIGRNIPKRG